LLPKLIIFGKEVKDNSHGVCSPVLHSQLTETQGIFVEFMISFILVLVICGIWDAKNKGKTDSTPLRFGLALGGLAIAAGPYTGGNMNPARTLAPAIINNYWTSHWVSTPEF
jgi:aquaporin related protein